MVKRLLHRAKLDKQLEQYLTEPLTLNDISEYSITRDFKGLTKATVTFYVDMERFEKEGIQSPKDLTPAEFEEFKAAFLKAQMSREKEEEVNG